MNADWHDAQVIEATTPSGWRGFLILDNGEYRNAAVLRTRREFLSDVRVIVDAEGRVTPPQITPEMIDRAARSLQSWNGRRPPKNAARAALAAALGVQP